MKRWQKSGRMSRDEMLQAMHDDLRGTSAAKSQRADILARCNDLTQYRIPGKPGYWYDPKEVIPAARGKALPKQHAA